jgi:hypothetical protein
VNSFNRSGVRRSFQRAAPAFSLPALISKLSAFCCRWAGMAKAAGLLLFVAALASPQSSMKEVVYQVNGTCKYVNLTLTSASGGKEQSTVKRSFELKFFTKGG